jgi:hypothetical protein
MPDQFLSYLQQERSRLDHELEQAQSGSAKPGEIARLRQLRNIVDDQLDRWSRDLTVDQLAA